MGRPSCALLSRWCCDQWKSLDVVVVTRSELMRASAGLARGYCACSEAALSSELQASLFTCVMGLWGSQEHSVLGLFFGVEPKLATCATCR